MQRANDLNRQSAQLLQQRLHTRAVFSDNVDVITPRFVRPVARVAGKSEAAERVRREKDPIGLVIADHHLRPMNHRRHKKADGMRAGFQRIALADNDGAVAEIPAVKGFDHLEGLRIADDAHRRIAVGQQPQCGGMVRLHMRNDEVIDSPVACRLLDTGQPFSGHTTVGSIEQNSLFVCKQIGIVRHTVRYAVLSFKEVQRCIRHSRRKQRRGNLSFVHLR